VCERKKKQITRSKKIIQFLRNAVRRKKERKKERKKKEKVNKVYFYIWKMWLLQKNILIRTIKIANN
jgi:hypothetical protein